MGMQAGVAVASEPLYERHVNPQWVRLLRLLRMDVRYTQCHGAELFSLDGKRYLDFLSGYCVHNVGHNHPDIIAALKDELDACGPAMLQSHAPELAGRLAARLCGLAGGRLSRVFFSSSGSEGIEAAIKFARAHTGRDGLLYLDGAFHGLTCGALSMMGSSLWKDGFGPLLPGAEQVPFNGLDTLERKLSTKHFAALFIEPVQGEGGVRLHSGSYLHEAQLLCRRYGTLFVADEVQTGLYRTGPFLASQHYGLDPDMVVLAKALSGGLIPSGALLMTSDIYASVYSSLERSIVHTSTFSENSLAMRAGLATLDVLERQRLGLCAAQKGAFLRSRLSEELADLEMVSEVRGLGLICGIEFQSPRQLWLRIPFEAFMRIHPGMFGQVVVMRLFQGKGILTQMCGNNFLTLKVAPPLVINEEQIEKFVSAIGDIVRTMHTSMAFWTSALDLAKRVVNA
jgi:ornithine--oxo-acid transaminase